MGCVTCRPLGAVWLLVRGFGGSMPVDGIDRCA